MKLLSLLCLSFLFSVCYASEEKTNSSENNAPEPIVLVCPEHTANKGDEVPKFATTVEAINFFCNDQQETEAESKVEVEAVAEQEP